MKENVLDVLIFLFDNYVCNDVIMSSDEDAISIELEEAGFEPEEISKAFDWLGGLVDATEKIQPKAVHKRSIRVYTDAECVKIDAASRGFMLTLEDAGLITPDVREIIIDRALAIEQDELSFAEFKRIIGLVLANQPDVDETSLFWLEDLIFDDIGVMH